MIEAHGGKLINRVMDNSKKESVLNSLEKYYQITIENRYVSDCEMISIGGFSPLTGFMNKETAESVINNMTLTDGTLWAIPIVLPLSSDDEKNISVGDEIILKDTNDRAIALMKISEKFSNPLPLPNIIPLNCFWDW